MKISSNIAVSDSGFIFNPVTGDSFSTNPVGMEIIRILKEDRKKADIIKMLREKFLIDQMSAEKDMEDFLLVLKGYQLINDYE
jgi:hypothetical protein